MDTLIIPKSFGTHDGAFHADEVTVCALLLLYDRINRDQIVRTRDLGKLKSLEYVCDVGGVYDPAVKRFDHHQVDYKGGLSSAGMVLQYLADQGVISDDLYHYFNQSLVIGVDAIDNGQTSQKMGHCSFSSIITNFVPANHGADDTTLFKAFEEAVDFTLGHLRRLEERFTYIRSCREKVKESMQKGQDYLVFEEAMPWMENFFELDGESHPALFVIMPSGPYWKLRGIPPSYDQKMKVRKSLPKHWAGLLEDELVKITKIPGAVFCHKGRFISIWKTKDDALKALQMVLKKPYM